jgi:hypothetical protein
MRQSQVRGRATGQRELNVATIHNGCTRRSLGFAAASLTRPEAAANRRFRRTQANRRERLRTLAMQKVVGSSPIIRFAERSANADLLVSVQPVWVR